MDYRYYEEKLNDIITKSPIEIGVEILVYNLLEECIDKEKYSIIDISTIIKSSDKRLVTDGGVPDIAVVSKDFKFKETDSGIVYGFVEVKAPGISLRETDQISGHLAKARILIYTNGIEWKIYDTAKTDTAKPTVINTAMEGLPSSVSKIKVNKEKFDSLIILLKSMKWLR